MDGDVWCLVILLLCLFVCSFKENSPPPKKGEKITNPPHPTLPIHTLKNADLLLLAFNPLAHERPPYAVRLPVASPNLRVYARWGGDLDI